MKVKTGLATLLACSQIMAATVAVIDSGVDYKHNQLATKMWVNPNEVADNGRDDDRNGYQDDVYGWNFAEANPMVIDYKYLGTFSQDPYKFFEIQARQFLGTVTEEDLNWIKEKREDPEFAKEMGKFGNFVHGTHVAGITVKENSNANILAVKLIPTEVSPFIANWIKENKAANAKANRRMGLVKSALEALASQQMTLLEEIAVYVNDHKAQVANGSFGTGYNQAKMITGIVFKGIFWRKPTAEEEHEVTVHFLNSLIKFGRKMVDQAPKTLFVFAAGNDGVDNDKYPTSPTNVQAPNVISVAATMKRGSIAVFSNYGIKNVDVAAPGVIIDSAIPGNETMKVSGTSQAAPYVANIALKVVEANENLTPAQVKKIIMGTVDLKDFLKDKVVTSGIVNRQRATRAAELAKSVSLDEAIIQANQQVADVETQDSKGASGNNYGIVLPLPSMFK